MGFSKNKHNLSISNANNNIQNCFVLLGATFSHTNSKDNVNKLLEWGHRDVL